MQSNRKHSGRRKHSGGSGICGGNAQLQLEDALDNLDASIEDTEEMKTVVAEINYVIHNVKKDGGDSTDAIAVVFNHLVPDPEPYVDKIVLESEKIVMDALAPEGTSKAEAVAKIKSVFDRMMDLYYDISVNINQTASKILRTVQGRNNHYATCVALHYIIKMRREEARKMRAKLVVDAEDAKTDIDMKRIVNISARWSTVAHILNFTFNAIFVSFLATFAKTSILYYTSIKNGQIFSEPLYLEKVNETDVFNNDPKGGLNPYIKEKTNAIVEIVQTFIHKFMNTVYLF